MLGWELPPRNRGTLGQACLGLSQAMAEKGDEIFFILPQVAGDEQAAHMRLFSVADGREYSEQIRRHQQERNARRPPTDHLQPTEKPAFGLAQAEGETQKKGGMERGTRDHRYFGTISPFGAELLSKAEAFTDHIDPFAVLDCDVVHAHNWMTLPAALKLRRKRGTRVIWHIHDLERERAGENANPTILDVEKAGIEQADHLITVSWQAKQHLMAQFGVPDHRISVVHHGVSREEAQRRYDLKKTDPVKTILFAGPIIFQRGPEYFVDAAAKVVQHEKNVRFIMSGSGDKLDSTIRLVNEWGLGNYFHFTGLLQGADLERIFTLADLYVMPSVSDPFSLSALEAVTYDTPVIISKQSAAAEILRHALKCDFWDVNRLAELILAVLKYPALVKDVKAMAKRELEHLHWYAAAEKVHDIYKKVLNW